MKHLLSAIILFIAQTALCFDLKAQELHNLTVHHDLKIELYPETHRIAAEDLVTLPESYSSDFSFLLHEGLAPFSGTPGVSVIRDSDKQKISSAESFKIKISPGRKQFVLKYNGRIHHPLEDYGKEYARGFKQTIGLISKEGVYLSGESYWYPHFGEALVTFNLKLRLPPDWNGISQGERTLQELNQGIKHVQWKSTTPQEEIYIVAARFTEYTKPAGQVEAMVFLRQPDEELASRYLEATERYLAMYEKLIGPYPYKKFALVENFWETGFGIPSFTLLGPKVIRFPFILHSSYPHEILHNWWGNSVFPEYEKGNWTEGLTAYLADHLIKEQMGLATEYPQATLQKYTDYVSSERDFPLTEFKTRLSSPTEAVGYGKSLMFFHMLRLGLSDEMFVGGLREFYHKYRFRLASFTDLQRIFEEVSGKNLEDQFNQWINRTGAPEITISDARAQAEGSNYILTALLKQIQPGEAYFLRIPVAVTMEKQSRAYQTQLVMEEKRLQLNLRLPAEPLRIDIDPEFDLFRKLNRDEVPPALTQAFGAKKVLVLLPTASTDEALFESYRKLSRSWSQSGPEDVEVKLDSEMARLPSDRAAAIFGWDNLFLNEITAALSEYDVSINRQAVRIEATKLQRKNHCVVLTARHPKNKDMALTWVASDVAQALPGLARKLPHYQKYSYLGFKGAEPVNILKGRWPILNSPMSVFVPREDGTVSAVERGKLASREPLVTLSPVFSSKHMIEVIRFLSSDELRGRGFGTEELDLAAEFIAKKFREAGLQPAGDTEKTFYQAWKSRAGDPERTIIMKNIIGVIPGQRPQMAKETVVIGAHYDHLGLGWPDVREQYQGQIHHGANDNASGVAVLIELARVLGKSLKPDRNLVFAAFSGEEAGKLGSKYYLANLKRFPTQRCIGMINLDTVGRLEKKKLLVFGTGSAHEWKHTFKGASFVTGVDIEMIPENLDSSDQTSFQVAGVPAVQLFTGADLDYHRPSDTTDKIDPEGLVKVASVTLEVIEYLVGRKEPLSSTLKAGGEIGPAPKKARKVILGTVPDFAYSGQGYRLSGVLPGSPAELSGLREGDVIIGINSSPVQTLKALSDILKSLEAGGEISIVFLRNGKEKTVKTTLVER